MKQQDIKSIPYELQVFDEHHNETFREPLYFKEDQDYTEILKKIVEILKTHHFDIYLEEFSMIIIGGRLQNEKYIVFTKKS